jgi:hypothetical protein
MNRGAALPRTASALLSWQRNRGDRAWRKRRERWGVAVVGISRTGGMLAVAVSGTYSDEITNHADGPLPRPMAAFRTSLIVLDTQRADHLSSYGYHRPTTHLDSLAAEGVLFEWAFAASS